MLEFTTASHDLKKWDTETSGIYTIYRPSGPLVAPSLHSGHYSPGALRFLNRIDPSVSVFNYYIYIALEGVLLNSMSVLVNLTLGLALIWVNFDPIQEKNRGWALLSQDYGIFKHSWSGISEVIWFVNCLVTVFLGPSTFDVEWSLTVCLDMHVTVIQFVGIHMHRMSG